jgi:small-conductance mechanosensitive channel
LDFVLMCWIEDAAKRARILGEINTAIYDALGRHGIEIPFPKRDVYIKELPQALLGRTGPGTRPTAVP